ncbi:hypothetical protein L6R52_09205 [Myxococcota bacterium]|nr:hypothetical protein [Myxococcota bacterium]
MTSPSIRHTPPFTVAARHAEHVDDRDVARAAERATDAPVAVPSAIDRPIAKSVAAGLLLGLVAPFTSFAQLGPRAPRGPDGPSLVTVRLAPTETPEYDAARANSDRHLAKIFGGDNAVAAGNGFEPPNMWHDGKRQYRGDPSGRGHLDFDLHLYGSDDGNTSTGLYIPPGFRYLGPMTTENGRENGGHTFFYEKLGALKNVYLLTFHVKDFHIDRSDVNGAGSIRIGDIGGPGGAPYDLENPPKRNGKVSLYLHAHLAIQKSPRGGAKKIPFPTAFPTPPTERVEGAAQQRGGAS